MRNVLFVCVHNSGRSQMARALFDSMAGNGLESFSAGTQPATDVNSMVISVMSEIGLDISNERPKLLTQDMLDNAEKVITMGCFVDEVCPANVVPTEDWGLEDPKEKSVEKAREIRDQIRGLVSKLLEEMG